MGKMKAAESEEKKRRRPKKVTLLLETGVKWYDILAGGTNTITNNDEIEELYKKEITAYQQQKNFQNLSWATKEGTLRDKIAAYRTLLDDSLAHNLQYLEILINMVTPKCKREAISAMSELHEVITSSALPANRKLISLTERNVNQQTLESQALLWYVEDRVKTLFKQLLEHLDTMTFDNVIKTKLKAVQMMAEFLMNYPEQEQYLLSKLCNKLGDPCSKIGAQISHLLAQILFKHPNMRMVVIKEVEQFLYRPNLSQKAQYYGLNFLTQVILDDRSTELANKIIKIYLNFFTNCAKTNEVNNKMMKVLLIGASRAFPYAKNNIDQEQIESLFSVIHKVKFATSVQALTLLFQILDKDGLVSDRFYSSLYRKLIDPELSHSNYHQMFLNLLYRALIKDCDRARLKAFIKRILQVSYSQDAGLITSLLYLVSRLKEHHKEIFTPPKIIDTDDEEEYYEDILDDEATEAETTTVQKPSTTVPGWIHRKITTDQYDPLKRDPRYSGAENSQIYEFYFTANHIHPSVRSFQSQLDKDGISYSGDPLTDFTLIKFLERFIFRNPKKDTKLNNQHSFFKKKNLGTKIEQNIQSEEYTNQEEETVAPAEKFIYKYMKHRKEMGEPIIKSKSEEDDDDNMSITSEDFDAYLNKYESHSGLNFASSMLSSKKDKNLIDMDSNDDDDDDEDINYDDDEDYNNAVSDSSGEEVEDDEEEDMQPRRKKKKRDQLTFANAEDFDPLINDDDDDDDIDMTTSQAVANPDKAHHKQLQWEKHQNQWIKGNVKNKRGKFSTKRKHK